MFKSEHLRTVPNVQKIIGGEKNLEKVSCN